MLSSTEWKVSRPQRWGPQRDGLLSPGLSAQPIPLGLLPKAFTKEWVLGLFVRRPRGPVGPFCPTLWYLGSLPGKHVDRGSKVYTDTHPPF